VMAQDPPKMMQLFAVQTLHTHSYSFIRECSFCGPKILYSKSTREARFGKNPDLICKATTLLVNGITVWRLWSLKLLDIIKIK
jgi:hypothetical protein